MGTERESYGEAEQLLNTNPALQPDTHHVLLNYDISWMSSISSLIIEISSSSTYAGREREIKRERFKEICTMKLLKCILAENQGIFFSETKGSKNNSRTEISDRSS